MRRGLDTERGQSRAQAGASQHRRNRNEGTRPPGALSLQPPRPPRGGAVGRDPGDRAGTPGAGMRPENF